MRPPGSYQTPGALRTALEQRLKNIAGREGIDLQRLRRQVAFDRLLARFFTKPDGEWALKGGYAMELRLKNARATKDIDLSMSEIGRSDAGSTIGEAVRLLLQDRAADDPGDFFDFLIGEQRTSLDGAPRGGARYPVDARLDGRTFVRFHVDVGIGDVILQPLELIETRDWLAFAGIDAVGVPAITREQQFAEKLHAYTLPNRAVPNSRVRDLVDMRLLIEAGDMDFGRIRVALSATFERRNTHSVPECLQEPAEDWERPFALLAMECGLEQSMEEAFSRLESYLDQVFSSKT